MKSYKNPSFKLDADAAKCIWKLLLNSLTFLNSPTDVKVTGKQINILGHYGLAIELCDTHIVKRLKIMKNDNERCMKYISLVSINRIVNISIRGSTKFLRGRRINFLGRRKFIPKKVRPANFFQLFSCQNEVF